MEKNIAIQVKKISKTFRIPHEKVNSLRGAAVSIFKDNSYEEFKALDDVSFEVKKGEFFGIIGRNGSGKSTLLKILAGIYKPDKGKVKIDGMISPFLELGIGFNPELSGRDNVYLNATVLGMTKKQIDEKFDDIVKFSELERFIDQKLKNYSSGMQVRLAFSVSIHANRDILLMDEVLAVGDSNFQSKCLEEFNKYRDMGRTVIIVTHDINVVEKYCNRALLLCDGKILEIGKANDVADKYIQKNILDEEQRMGNESGTNLRLKNDSRGKVEISKVEFLDKNEKNKNVFRTGEKLSVRVYFKNIDQIKLNFGIALYDQEVNYIFGINTLEEEFDSGPSINRGFFQLNYDDIVLRTNAYYVKIGIWGADGNYLCDYLERSQLFRVFSDDKNQGMIDMKCYWE